MDLATAIVDKAADTFRDECQEKKCVINITLRGRYAYIITIIPMNKHVVIKYKTLEYKIAKENKKDYDNILEFLYLAIKDDAELSLGDDDDDNEETFNINILSMKRQDTKLFYAEFKFENFGVIFKTYLETLRNMM